VRSRVFRGDDYSVEIAAGGVVLEAILPQGPRAGERIRLRADPQGVSLLDAP